MQVRKDYTKGSITRHILSLTIPGTGAIAVVSVSSLADAYWLGRLGSDALAAASMGMALRMVMISLLMGVSMGGSALVARYVGANDHRRANRAALQMAFLVTGFVGFLGIAGYVWARPLLHLVGARGEVLSLGVEWFRVVCLGLLFMELLPSMNQALYGAGSPEKALLANLVASVSLMVLEPLLVLGWGPVSAMGIRGAALAQVLGSAAGVALQAYFFLSGKARVKVDRQDFRVDSVMMGRVMRLAVPTGVTRLMTNLAATLAYAVMAPFGAAVVAGYSIASKVLAFSFALPGGVATAPQALVGQNLGAAKPERAKRAGWLAAGLAAMITAAEMVVILILDRRIVALFSDSVDVMAESVRCLRFLALAQIAYSADYCLSASLRSAGDTVSPMWINLGSLWLVSLPLMYGLGHVLGWGPVGIWSGMGIAHLVQLLAMAVRFRQGKWMTREV